MNDLKQLTQKEIKDLTNEIFDGGDVQLKDMRKSVSDAISFIALTNGAADSEKDTIVGLQKIQNVLSKINS